jgi:hypothetical protein
VRTPRPAATAVRCRAELPSRCSTRLCQRCWWWHPCMLPSVAASWLTSVRRLWAAAAAVART